MQPQHKVLVRIGDWPEIAFQKASGLEAPTAEHRPKIPSVHKVGDVTLKRGVVANSAALREWIQHAKPQPVVIKLLDVHGRVTATWKLTKARPVKVNAPDLNAKGNEIAIESIELAHEGLKLLD